MSFPYFISSRGCAIFYHQIFRYYIHVISKQNKDKKNSKYSEQDSEEKNDKKRLV